MNMQLSIDEHVLPIDNQTGDSQMEKDSLKKIKEMKQIKKVTKITYMDIMEKMAEIDETSMVSLSTLRRIFADGSEMKAGSFNYDEVLCPAYNAVKALEGQPKDESPFAKELDGYKAVIRVQNEELDRLLELKEHLDDRVNYLVDQTKTKDAQINFLMKQLDEKGEIIQRLMSKCL